MYKLYSITKEKSKIRGFWQDKNGKIYRDNIQIKFLPYKRFLINRKMLFDNKENAIFYCIGNKAFIENVNGKMETLNHKIMWHENNLKPSLVKALLVQHGGLTIFKNENSYTLEIWKD